MHPRLIESDAATLEIDDTAAVGAKFDLAPAKPPSGDEGKAGDASDLQQSPGDAPLEVSGLEED
jgi:hypothetical protein